MVMRFNNNKVNAVSLDSYSQMWNTLAIDNAPKVKPDWSNKWQNVIVDNKWIPANDVIKSQGYACDASPLAIGGFNNVNLNQINNLAIDNVFLGWGELSQLQVNCIVSNFMVTLADSMTDKWIEFKSENKTKKKKIQQLEASIAKFDLKNNINLGLGKTVLLGTMYVSPKLKGDEDDLSEPLLISSTKIKKRDLEDIYFIEPQYVAPIDFNMSNPRKPNFYKPNLYSVNGDLIHSSRMQRLVFIEPVNTIAGQYLFGGIPPIQTFLPNILDFMNSKREIVKIVSRYNISILNTDINAIPNMTQSSRQGGNMATCFNGRAQAFNMLRNNFGIYLLGKDEVFTQMQINVSGLKDILQQQGEFLSLFSRIPVAKLFGQSPSGLSSTGEFDADNYNEMIHSLQESKLRPILQYCIDLIQLNEFGEIDPEITFDFVPLGELSETVQSQLKTERVARDTSVVNAGMADPQKMMQLMVDDPSLDYTDYKTAGDENLNDLDGPDEPDNLDNEKE